MSDVALRMEHVYKKFRKGEVYNSLRDFLPALTGQMFRQQQLNEHDHRDFWALQDISFEVKRGDALGIIGANGAGKSTILKILSRIMVPTSGNMVVNGRLSALIEVSAGFHQDLTGRENIYLNGAILGMTKREIDSKLDQIIAFSGIEEFIDTPVKRYSSGMYARLGFSVAAHVNADVLIVDEVLSVGDTLFQQKCIARMKEVIRDGMTVLFVSHNLKSVAEFCHRCLLLQRGRILLDCPTDEAVSAYLNGIMNVSPEDEASRAVIISRVAVRDENGPAKRFMSGQKAWIDIDVVARDRCNKLSIALSIKDDNLQELFNTSTERLGHGNFTLEPGETFSCTFELSLNIPGGLFYASIVVYRYDTQTKYDSWLSPAISISPEEGVLGFANCFPKVTRYGSIGEQTATVTGLTKAT
jgi:lipopolysaccharide transport system ATP-binding protein